MRPRKGDRDGSVALGIEDSGVYKNIKHSIATILETIRDGVCLRF